MRVEFSLQAVNGAGFRRGHLLHYMVEPSWKNTGYGVGMCELSQQYEHRILKVEKRIRFLFLLYLSWA